MKILIIVTISIALLMINCGVDAYVLEAGNTDVGRLYVYVDSSKPVAKQNKLYLAVLAEEVFTDTQFLKVLREADGLEHVTGAFYIYLFDNNGEHYTIFSHQLVDDKGKVCLDVGKDDALHNTKEDLTMVNVFAKSLEYLEAKNKLPKSIAPKK